RTRRYLSGLIGDEIVEIGDGVHAARALCALAEADVAEIARGDVRIDRLDGAAELARGLVRCTQSIRRRRPRRPALPLYGRCTQSIGRRRRRLPIQPV